MNKDIPIKTVPQDDDSSFDEANLLMLTEIQPGVSVGVDRVFNHYIEICGNSTLDGDQWMGKDDLFKFALCIGLGYKEMKLSDIINQAVVKGCVELAKFNENTERELKITESE